MVCRQGDRVLNFGQLLDATPVRGNDDKECCVRCDVLILLIFAGLCEQNRHRLESNPDPKKELPATSVRKIKVPGNRFLFPFEVAS